ncbi:glycosyltransferase family 39 protein [Actinoplanes oblitus]|uniref:Glycosyltransferase family 39 protein n=1 Tax=Actinoplanes oblitus TaxID=3040509 RepID=A0ABY8WFN5_9ACTN|nr:glycosyltransferase family 39 protein [Actinoplanes oblitus]WIM94545.1 glycosyltransferase family 39 protein [Actinoplanes oblitus]
MATTNTVTERASTEDASAAERARERRPWLGLTLIMVLAAGVRLYRFPDVPRGLNQDEVSAGYETLSLLTAGTDRWGTRWPVYFTAFGSGQNVLLSYLNMPFVAILGPTPLGLRLLPALLGVLTVAVTYALTARLAGRRAGLLAALLLAACPWHVMMSRWSLESNLLPPVMVIAVWVLVVAYQSPRRWLLPVSLMPMALVFYAYAAATLVVLLFVAAFLATRWRTVRRRPVAAAASLGLFGLVALPYGIFLLVNQVLHRAPGWLSALPFGVQLLPGSRVQEINTDGLVAGNLRFAVQGFSDNLPWNVMSPYLPFGLVIVPLAAVGGYFAVRDRAYPPVLWLAATLPMFFLVRLNVNRINALFLPLIILAALGLDGIARSIAEARTGRAVIAAFLSVGLLYNAAFVQDYFTGYNDVIRTRFADGLDRALTVAERRSAPGAPIYVSDRVPLNYLYVLFYRKVDPREFRANAAFEVRNTVYFVRDYRSFYFHQDDPALVAAPEYLGVFRVDEPRKCAGTTPATPRRVASVGAFRIVSCRR